jgi:putative membrane protein
LDHPLHDRLSDLSFDVTDLPAVNASLNATSTVLLLIAYRAIRRMDIDRHRRFMLAAAATSGLFLVSYLIYHAQVGSVPFTRPGAARAVYFAILIPHTVLAVVSLPVVLRTLYLGLKRRDDKHRRIARWAFPIWLYVSVTGVIVYVMLYHLYPPLPIR